MPLVGLATTMCATMLLQAGSVGASHFSRHALVSCHPWFSHHAETADGASQTLREHLCREAPPGIGCAICCICCAKAAEGLPDRAVANIDVQERCTGQAAVQEQRQLSSHGSGLGRSARAGAATRICSREAPVERCTKGSGRCCLLPFWSVKEILLGGQLEPAARRSACRLGLTGVPSLGVAVRRWTPSTDCHPPETGVLQARGKHVSQHQGCSWRCKKPTS